MSVVSDTTPLNYLILIQRAEILPILYSQVVIPEAVAAELRSPSTPAIVRAWILDPPSWLIIRKVVGPLDPALERLHNGEREAIHLAQQVRADGLVIDDLDGRREAQARNLAVTGTLGVLDEAAGRGMIDLSEVFGELQQTSFRASAELYRTLLDRAAER